MRTRRLIWLPLVALLVMMPALSSPVTVALASWPTPDLTTIQQDGPNLNVESVVRDLDTIWAIAFAPDGRIFLTERGGHIRTVRDGVLDPEPWISLDVTETGESGLMGLALDPDFAQNGYLYTTYTYTAKTRPPGAA